MKQKRLLTAVLVVAMIISMAVPAMAAVTRQTEAGYYTDNAEKYKNYNHTGNDIYSNYPCWIWSDDGNCYYFLNAATVLKNATTPDGYTVDAEGRWVVNGQIQSNGYGYQVMGTDVYNGKSNNEIWNLMVNKLEGAFSKGIPLNNTGLTYAYWRTKDQGIAYDLADVGESGNKITITHNNAIAGTFVTASIGGSWSDFAKNTISSSTKAAYYNNAYVKEQAIKAVVGDKIGQELFTSIRNTADQLDTSGGYKTILDENGKPIKGRYETILDANGDLVERRFHEDPNGTEEKREWFSEPVGDGMQSDKIDLSAWKNRTTDYGKTFSVVFDNGLKIHVLQ